MPETSKILVNHEQKLESESETNRQQLNDWRLREQETICKSVRSLSSCVEQMQPESDKQQVAINALKNALNRALQTVYDRLRRSNSKSKIDWQSQLHKAYAQEVEVLQGKLSEYQSLFSTPKGREILLELGIQPDLLMLSCLSPKALKRRMLIFELQKRISHVCALIDATCTSNLDGYQNLLPVLTSVGNELLAYCEETQVTADQYKTALYELNAESTLKNHGHSSQPTVMLRKQLYAQLFGTYARLDLDQSMKYVIKRRLDIQN